MHPAGPQDVTDTHHTSGGQPGNLIARIARSCLIQCACMSPTFVSARWIEKLTDLYVVVAGSRYPFALWSRSGAQVERVAAHGLMSVCDKLLGPIRCSWHHYCLDIRHAALQEMPIGFVFYIGGTWGQPRLPVLFSTVQAMLCAPMHACELMHAICIMQGCSSLRRSSWSYCISMQIFLQRQVI